MTPSPASLLPLAMTLPSIRESMVCRIRNDPDNCYRHLGNAHNLWRHDDMPANRIVTGMPELTNGRLVHHSHAIGTAGLFGRCQTSFAKRYRKPFEPIGGC